MTGKEIAKLVRLAELTRGMPMTGYVLGGIPKHELSDLSQHHYLVTFIAWILSLHIEKRGGKVDTRKTLELCLIHDLGELLGGDIAMPYARANTKAKELAKAFEEENGRFLTNLFYDEKDRIEDLIKESHEPTSDEAIIMKVADYIEVTHFKLYVKRLTEGDLMLAERAIERRLEKVKDEVVKKELKEIVKNWRGELNNMIINQSSEIFEEYKLKSPPF